MLEKGCGGSGEKEKEFSFPTPFPVRPFTLAKFRPGGAINEYYGTLSDTEGRREPERLGRYTCRDRYSNMGKPQLEWAHLNVEAQQYA